MYIHSDIQMAYNKKRPNQINFRAHENFDQVLQLIKDGLFHPGYIPPNNTDIIHLAVKHLALTVVKKPNKLQKELINSLSSKTINNE